jgi:hypothetical protein
MLMAARQATGPLGGLERYNYYFYGYIGNLLYCFEFAIDHTRDNMIRADPVHGRLLVRVEAISLAQPLPPNGVNPWALL